MLLGLVKVKDVKSSALLGFNHILQENVENGRGLQRTCQSACIYQMEGHNVCTVRCRHGI